MNLSNKKSPKAIIIGAGFGGLSLAIRLQARGYNTVIYEKSSMPGGHASQLVKNGYTFDLGPSIVTEPYLFEELFALNKEEFSDYVNLTSLDPFYRVYFHDKTYLDYTGDPNKMMSQLARFNESDAHNYSKFMQYSKNLYELVMKDGIGDMPFQTFKDLFKFLPDAIKRNAVLPSYYNASRYFKDFRSRFLFSFHSLFIGGNPFITPSVFLMLPYLEKEGGVWFAKGGMHAIVQELTALYIRMGGTLHTNAEVQEIVTDKNIVKGVTIEDSFVAADLVVSNAHFAHTYKDLIKSANRKHWTDKRVLNKKYSMSCFLLYLGVKKKYPELLHHTLILSERYKGLVKDIFANDKVPEDFSIYMHVPSITDAGMAPVNCESIYLLVPTPNLKANVEWSTFKHTFKDKLLKFLEDDFGLEDLRNNIEVLEMFTPDDFKNQRNNHLGAAWSIQPRIDQIGNFRPQNKSEDFKNLYLVGASVHPGSGVPGVLLSAKVTEKVINHDFGV